MDSSHLDPDDLGDHRPLSVDQLTGVLGDAPIRWGVCGGLAVDLFVGRSTRAHDDVEISVFRRQESLLRDRFAAWELWAAYGSGQGLDRLASSQSIPADVHEIWCRPSASDPWSLEIVFEDGDADTWIYRRDSRVRLPIADVFWQDHDLPVMRPEIVLLYKSKMPRDKDRHDLAEVLPKLPANQRLWLRTSVQLAHPNSPWASLV